MVRKQYYTAREAMQKLGLARSTFYDYVRDGRIPKPELPTFRKRGALWPVKQIDDLANAFKGFIQQFSVDQQGHTFRQAYPEDAPAIHEFGQAIFEQSGGYGPPVEILVEWFRNSYAEVGHILLDRDQIIGYFTMLPLAHEQIMRIMNREIRPRDIRAERLAPLEPGKPIDIFIAEFATEPVKRHVAAYLIGRMLTFFHNLGKQGVEIEGIYATASSRGGITICRKAGMKQMFLPNIQPDWIPFEMKVQETKNQLTKNYIQALKSYKKRHQSHN